MNIIAHRGLLYGPDKILENTPAQVERALAAGFEVEVDVWFKMVPDDRPTTKVNHSSSRMVRSSWWLGHDEPQYEVTEAFLARKGMWLHCKNVDALRHMRSEMHYFWHETDSYTLTSRGNIWCYPKKDVPHGCGAVIVLPEWSIDPEYDIAEALLSYYEADFIDSICTDYGGAMMDTLDRLRREMKMKTAAEVMSK